MTRKLTSFLKGFAAKEHGSMVVPFALWTPVFLGIILSTIELGTVTIRHTNLERALDEAVREVRLGTSGITTHGAIKTEICANATVLPDCEDKLHLEMVQLDMRSWSSPNPVADCTDTSLAVTPNRQFVAGSANEMMLLRACYKYRPITPAGTLSSSLQQDENGYTALVATSAFVHEPS